MILEADLEQAELRVIAALAHDEPYLEAFARGESPHRATARALFGRDCPKGTEEYVFAKSFQYRWQYSHPDRVVQGAGQLRTYRVQIDDTALARYTLTLNQVHPAVVAWKRSTLRALATTGCVVNPWGRRRDLGWAVRSHNDELIEHARNAALNFPIQSSVAEVLNDALPLVEDALQAAGLACAPIAQVHDSIVFECAQGQEREAAITIKEAMERPVDALGGVVLPVEVKGGPTWGELAPIKTTFAL